MAEGSTPVTDDQQDESAWWDGWWQTAKDKSSVALEFMKKDLTEFGQTVQQDAASAISATSSVVKQTLRLDDKDSVASQTKESFTALLGKISEAFYPGIEKEEDELLVIRNSQPIPVEKWHAHLYYIQTDPSNYSHKPDGVKEQYSKWLEDFSFEEQQADISDILINLPEVRNLYTGMVPTILSNLEFWQRFFYRVFQAKAVQTKRAELVKRANDGVPLEEFIWDDEEAQQKRQDKQPTGIQLKESLSEGSNSRTEYDRATRESGDANLPIIKDENLTTDIVSSAPDDSLDKAVIISSSPSSTETDSSRKTNTEDEWEKDFDLEDPILESKISKTSGMRHEDDWENWE